MVATIEQTIQTNLATLFAGVSGVRKAYVAAPMSLQVIDLPALIFLAGAATPTGLETPKWMEVRRDYVARIYIAAIQAGETGEAEIDVIPWINAITKIILAHPSLGTGTSGSLIPYVVKMKYLGDSGLALLPTYSGDQYLGVEFRLQLEYKIPYTFGSYE